MGHGGGTTHAPGMHKAQERQRGRGRGGQGPAPAPFVPRAGLQERLGPGRGRRQLHACRRRAIARAAGEGRERGEGGGRSESSAPRKIGK